MQEPTVLTIKELFNNSDKYSIPIYQRNYAWEEKEIIQLIKDVFDVMTQDKTKYYYLGTLIVNKKPDGSFDVIDGQQRLTTLLLVLCALKSYVPVEFENKLSFACREASNDTLNTLVTNPSEKFERKNNLVQGYEDSKKELRRIENIEEFRDYFLEKVKILRIEVPEHTDLNKYFEIMNSRGEQLEKHEILKAQMLNVLSDEPIAQARFNKVWEACSNLEKYLQMGFDFSSADANSERRKLFYNRGKENSVLPSKYEFEEWFNSPLEEKQCNDYSSKTISSLIQTPPSEFYDENFDKNKTRFGSVVNFPNFLLIVLSILLNNSEGSQDIPLDDKKLLEIFSTHIKNGEKKFVKEFCYALFKTRYLLDKYVIKRDLNSEKWHLGKLKYYSDNTNFSPVNTFNSEQQNNDIIMLLSMFHVSQPSTNYKYWLNAALNYLYVQTEKSNTEVCYEEYRAYLVALAEKFLRNRYLAKEADNYFEIIYNNTLRVKSDEELDFANFNQGTNVENFIFNYLDYKLWYANQIEYRKFKFTFRSSVEHFLPQSYNISEEILNSFGNLCLISSSKNSGYSNLPPEEKVKKYSFADIESIKQDIMMREAKNWDVQMIKNHQADMEQVLLHG